MVVTASAGQQAKARPWDVRCKVCGIWLAAVPGGSEWARVRCSNRRYNGQEGRNCPLYARQQTVKAR